MNLTEDVRLIIDLLYKNNFEAFVVGGSVRDYLLGKEPKDYDITTNALPNDIIKIFHKTVPTGIQHGTVTVIFNDIPYEITTYRIDGEYTDNRRPDDVIFVSNLKEDLSRRDFTINAMAYNHKEGLKDFFNGREDLNNKIIRCVGEPNRRFNEDALRILRAIRFSSQLNFSIEPKTFEAIKKNKNLLKNISIERVREELSKILLSEYPSKGLRLLAQTEILNQIIPEIIPTIDFDQKTPYHNKDVFEHTLSVVENCTPVLHVRLAALFHDIAKPQCFFTDEKGIGHFYGHDSKSSLICKEILKRLRFDNNTIEKTYRLISEHMRIPFDAKDSALKRLINRVGKDLIFDLFNLQRADIKSSAPPFIMLDKVEIVEKRIIDLLNSNVPLTSKDLCINGNILMEELNLNPGKEIGKILNFLTDKVLEDSSLNNKVKLLELARKYIMSL